MGARTNGVGRGVRWDAFGNIASLLARAGQARGEGYAALGAGIGGGINAFGANKRQEKRDAQAASEREAERGYRAGRDQVEDARYQEGMALRRAEFDFSKSDREADNRRQDALAMMAEKHREAETQRIIKQAETNVEGQELDRLMKVWALKSQSDEDTQGGISPETASLGKRLQVAVELNAKKRGVSLPADEPQPSVGAPALDGAPLSGGAAPAGAPGSISPTEKGATLSSPDGMFFAKTLGDLELQMQDAPDVAALSQIQGLMLGQVKQTYEEVQKATANLKRAKHYQQPAAASDLSRAQVKFNLAMTVGSRAIKTAGEARKGLATRSAERAKQERRSEAETDPAFATLTPEEQASVTRREDINTFLSRRNQQANAAVTERGAIQRLQNTRHEREVKVDFVDRDGFKSSRKERQVVWDMQTEDMNDLVAVAGYQQASPEMRAAAQAEIQRRQGVDPAAAGDPDVARVEAEEKRLGRPLTDAETVSLFGKGR